MIVPVMLESFIINGVVGKGTSGIIYRAWDTENQRDVAIKVFTNTEEEGNKRIEQAIGEAKALVEVRHPNVVQVYAIGTTKGAPYVVMELLDGGSLKDLIVDGAFIDEETALEYAIDIAEALYRTSQKRLLHLDVKPGNILFDKKGRPKLLDFGYASVNTNHRQSEILGTPYYVSPELVRQLPADHRCDIYSLGATLFHILCGQAPFEGETIREICLKRLNNKAPNIQTYKKDITNPTAEAIAKMLEEHPDDRPQTYEEVLADLRHARLSMDMQVAHLWDDQNEKQKIKSPAKTQIIYNPNKYKTSIWPMVFIIIGLLIITAGIFYWVINKNDNKQSNTPNPITQPENNTSNNIETQTQPDPPKISKSKTVILEIEVSTGTKKDAEQLLDNNLLTIWSAEGAAEWIALTLDRPTEFDRLQIAWSRGSERNYIFELQSSLDGLTWSKFYEGTSTGNTAGYELYKFDKVITRFVRIYCKGSNKSLWNYVSDIKIGDLEYKPLSN